jgi:glycosidase
MPTSVYSQDVKDALAEAAARRTKHVTVNGRARQVAAPFPSPEDWRDQRIYFLLVDRFNNPGAAPLHPPWDGAVDRFQGGTFNGVRAQLDYLRDLGMTALWLSPVLKNCQYSPFTYHGYGIQDFLQVDPRFASDPPAAQKKAKLVEDELQALVDAAHARGIYVIFDIVLNHTGDVFAYVLDDGRRVSEAGWRDREYAINWRDSGGQPRADWVTPPSNPPSDAVVWPEELQRNELFRKQGKGGEAGGDFASLKELVSGFTESNPREGFHFPVRNVLIRAFQYLIAKYDIDGFRIDTLKFIEPDFAQVFGNAMREFALSIGKKNFFTFGEVYDNEETIARFIGRHAGERGDMMGVDAALDFPLFFRLPGAAKGLVAPAELVGVFEHRKDVQRDLISSHGEAGRFFVTFLDNHDQHQRFYFSEPGNPDRFADQLTVGVACLYTLQGIPCLYYGTEQALHGAGGADLAVREALWGKPNAFDRTHAAYRAIRELGAVRDSEPALRYGRQYFRPLSGDGVHFGISPFRGGVLAFSRILNDREVIVVANTNAGAGWTGEVIVDFALNPVGTGYKVLFSNRTFSATPGATVAAPGPVVEKASGSVNIREIDGTVTTGPARVVSVALQPMEAQILAGSRV